jgi:hypothetical protein
MISVDLKGDNKLREQLHILSGLMEDKVKAMILEVAFVDIETFAKKEVPVDTGRLRASIHTKFKSKGDAKALPLPESQQTFSYTSEGQTYNGTLREPIKELEVIVGTNVEYAKKINREGGGGPNSRSQLPKGTGQGFMDKAAANGRLALRREAQALVNQVERISEKARRKAKGGDV